MQRGFSLCCHVPKWVEMGVCGVGKGESEVNINIGVTDAEIILSVDDRVIDTDVTNINMVIRCLEGVRERMIANAFFEQAAKDVDFKNPGEDRVLAFLRKLVDKELISWPDRPIDEVYPEFLILWDRGYAQRSIFWNQESIYPTVEGVWHLARTEGRDPDIAVKSFMSNSSWAKPGSWWDPGAKKS